MKGKVCQTPVDESSSQSEAIPVVSPNIVRTQTIRLFTIISVAIYLQLEERRTKQRAHKTQHIREKRDNFSYDECEHPCYGDDRSPCDPPNGGIRMTMLRVFEKAEEHEARRDALE